MEYLGYLFGKKVRISATNPMNKSIHEPINKQEEDLSTHLMSKVALNYSQNHPNLKTKVANISSVNNRPHGLQLYNLHIKVEHKVDAENKKTKKIKIPLIMEFIIR